MFAGSYSSGERAAAAYSVIEKAKLNGFDPEGYFRQVLARIAAHPLNEWTNCCYAASGAAWVNAALLE